LGRGKLPEGAAACDPRRHSRSRSITTDAAALILTIRAARTALARQTRRCCFCYFPKEDWQIASTNPLERVNKEIIRRSDVVSAFPNDDATIRLGGALMI